MSNGFLFPPTGFGPGSQPADDEDLAYLALPSGMRTYVPHLPEVSDPSEVTPALKTLADIADACDIAAAGGERAEFDLSGMAPASRALIAETLGQGEVSMKLRGVPALMVQESVFAGVWMLVGADVDRIEVGEVPSAAILRAHRSDKPAPMLAAPRPAGVVNAPALLAELADQAAIWRPGQPPHVINLSLLPHTEEDLLWLEAALGQGAASILSRGYGNCRIGACALPRVWRVQFFNSMDTLILDTFEVTTIPEVALAAREDLADSGGRIREVLEAIR